MRFIKGQAFGYLSGYWLARFASRFLRRIVPVVLLVFGKGLALPAAGESRREPMQGPDAEVLIRGGCEADTFAVGVKVFGDRTYKLKECPDWLKGRPFARGSIMRCDLRVVREGVVTLLTPGTEAPGAASQATVLERDGFVRILQPEQFQLFGTNAIDRVRVYQKKVAAGKRLMLGKWAVPVGVTFSSDGGDRFPVETETLCNGIVLARDPRDRTDLTAYGDAPLPVPYLEKPPAVIPISLGRQLFVDDFLIEHTTLRRVWHKAVKDARNPVLKPETPLECGASNGHCPMAAPFSGGVWYDAKDRLFKAWYCAGWFDGTAYAFSKDGLTWTRPELKAVPGTNRVIPPKGVRDSAAVVMDPDAGKEGMRFKMLVWSRPQGGELFVSRDGLSWSEPVAWAPTGDRSTIFYNPFRRVWVYSIRSGWHARSREYSESADFLGGADLANRVNWLRADSLDLPSEHWFYAFPERRPGEKGMKPSLYNFDAVAYESLMLGAFTLMQGPENNFDMAEGVPKMTEIHLGFSRDGYHWSRPDDRTPFIPGGRKAGTWDRAYLHSNAALCLVVGDELWFYYTGFAGDPSRKAETSAAKNGMYANASMGIARLRRDGFASMDAGAEVGVLTTRPLTFDRGSSLFVNAAARGGELRAEVLDVEGRTIKGLGLDLCVPMSSDGTRWRMRWTTGCDLASLQGKPVRFRFHLTNGSLYAFWVSDGGGSSDGFLAGGGPGYGSLRDTKAVSR